MPKYTVVFTETILKTTVYEIDAANKNEAEDTVDENPDTYFKYENEKVIDGDTDIWEQC